MDAQKRLTRWDEWRIGQTYEWVKGSQVTGKYKCVEVQPRRYIVLERACQGGGRVGLHVFAWTHRYRKIDPPAIIVRKETPP